MSVFLENGEKNLRFQKKHHTNVIHTSKGGFPMLRNFYERACVRDITQQ